jgi:hypothetical protein
VTDLVRRYQTVNYGAAPSFAKPSAEAAALRIELAARAANHAEECDACRRSVQIAASE